MYGFNSQMDILLWLRNKVLGAGLLNFLWFQKETEVNLYRNETLEHYTVVVRQSILFLTEPDPDFHLKTAHTKCSSICSVAY